MQAVQPKESRSAEYAQSSAKTDGMSKGGNVGAGGDNGNIIATLKRGGSEFSQNSAKTDGLCK